MDTFKPMVTNKIPLQVRSPSQAQSLTNTSAALRKAKEVVRLILSRYPDFDKSPPEYMLGLVQLVAMYPETVQNAFADIRNGISSRCKFMPTAAEFVAQGDEIEAYQRKWSIPAKPARQVDTEEYNPVMVPQCFDKRGNRISEREFEETRERLARQAAAQAINDRFNAYARHIGGGDLEKGWHLMIDKNVEGPPDDFCYPPQAVHA